MFDERLGSMIWWLEARAVGSILQRPARCPDVHWALAATCHFNLCAGCVEGRPGKRFSTLPAAPTAMDATPTGASRERMSHVFVSAEAAHVAARRHVALVEIPDSVRSSAEHVTAGTLPLYPCRSEQNVSAD